MQKPLLVIGVPHELEFAEMVGGYLSRVLKPRQKVSMEFPGRDEELNPAFILGPQGQFFQKIGQRILSKGCSVETVEHFGLCVDQDLARHGGNRPEYDSLSFKRSSEMLRQALQNKSHVLIVGYTHACDIEYHAMQLKELGVPVKVKYVLTKHPFVNNELKTRSAFLRNLPTNLHSFRTGFGVIPIEPKRVRIFH